MPTRKISQKLHENSTCLPQSKFSLFWTSHTIHLGVQKNWWFLPSPPSSNNNIITSIDLSLFQFSGAYYRIRWLLNIKLWMSKEKLFHTHTIRQSNKFATSEKHLSSFFFEKQIHGVSSDRSGFYHNIKKEVAEMNLLPWMWMAAIATRVCFSWNHQFKWCSQRMTRIFKNGIIFITLE